MTLQRENKQPLDPLIVQGRLGVFVWTSFVRYHLAANTLFAAKEK